MRAFLALWAVACLALGACSDDSEVLTTDLVVNTASASGSSEGSADMPVVEVDAPAHDLGTVARGERPEHVFELRNAGSGDLVLADVTAPCGCTVPKDWPREPIPPDGTASIRVQFDSKDVSGPFEKEITVLANTSPAITTLRLTGTVVGPRGEGGRD